MTDPTNEQAERIRRLQERRAASGPATRTPARTGAGTPARPAPRRRHHAAAGTRILLAGLSVASFLGIAGAVAVAGQSAQVAASTATSAPAASTSATSTVTPVSAAGATPATAATPSAGATAAPKAATPTVVQTKSRGS